MALEKISALESHENAHHLDYSLETETTLTTDESLKALEKANIDLGHFEDLPGITASEWKDCIWNLVATGKVKLDKPFDNLKLSSIFDHKNFDENSGFNLEGSNYIRSGDGMIKFRDLGEFGERIIRELKLQGLFDEKRKHHFNIKIFESLEGNTYAYWESFFRTLMEQGDFDFNPYKLDGITRFGLEPVLDKKGKLKSINFFICNLDMPNAYTVNHTFEDHKISTDNGLGGTLKRQWNQQAEARFKEGQPNELAAYDVRKAMKQDSMSVLSQIAPTIPIKSRENKVPLSEFA